MEHPLENIVRFRCYFCGCRAWEPLANFKLESREHNTLIALCDQCNKDWDSMTPPMKKKFMERRSHHE